MNERLVGIGLHPVTGAYASLELHSVTIDVKENIFQLL